MKYKDFGPNIRRAAKTFTLAALGTLMLAACGNGEEGTNFGLQMPLPSCERGDDAPIKTWGIKTGESIRLAKGDIGKNEITDGAVVTPTGNGEFTIDKVNKDDSVGVVPNLGSARFQSDRMAYDVQSQFSAAENRTAFIISPVCEPPKN